MTYKDGADFADTWHDPVVEVGGEHLALGGAPGRFVNTCELAVLLGFAYRVLDSLFDGLAWLVGVKALEKSGTFRQVLE